MISTLTACSASIRRRAGAIRDFTPRDLPLTTFATLLLVTTLFTLRRSGVAGARRRLDALCPAIDRPAHSGQAADIVRAVRFARCIVPARVTCLPKSMVLAAMLRHRGIDADLQIGVAVQDGFNAHAWVEVGGEPIDEPSDVVATFAPLHSPSSPSVAADS